MSDAKSYEPGQHPSLPPPKNLVGWQRWVWDNLFGTVSNTVLTLLSVYLLYLIIPGMLDYFVLDAVISANSRAECAELGKGACWAFIGDRFQVFIYGFQQNCAGALTWPSSCCLLPWPRCCMTISHSVNMV